MKLGCLFLTVAGIWLLEHSFEERFSVRQQWLVLFGVESLFVYVIHLILLYGCVLNPGLDLSSGLKGTLGWAASLGVSGVFLGVLYGATKLWNFVKTDHPVLFRGITWWLAGSFILEFFTRPY
jgi:hypothetical protein